MLGIVWISLNEGVSVGASDHCGEDISECMRNEPSLELTWLAPTMSSY